MISSNLLSVSKILDEPISMTDNGRTITSTVVSCKKINNGVKTVYVHELDKSDEIEDLKADNNRLKLLETSLTDQIHTLEEEISTLNQENKELETQYNNVNEHISFIQSENDYLSETNSQLRAELGTTKNQKNQLEEENSQLNNQLSSIQSENTQLEEENSQLNNQLSTIQTENTQLEEENIQLKSDLEALQTWVGHECPETGQSLLFLRFKLYDGVALVDGVQDLEISVDFRPRVPNVEDWNLFNETGTNRIFFFELGHEEDGMYWYTLRYDVFEGSPTIDYQGMTDAIYAHAGTVKVGTLNGYTFQTTTENPITVYDVSLWVDNNYPILRIPSGFSFSLEESNPNILQLCSLDFNRVKSDGLLTDNVGW